MKKLVTSALITSVVLLFASCSSDDSSTNPSPPATSMYSISKIHHVDFYNPADTNTEEPVIRSVNLFDFNYKEDSSFNFIIYTIKNYEGNENTSSESFKMEHKLNQEGKLNYFAIGNDTRLIAENAYLYNKGILTSAYYKLPRQNFSFESIFTYNAKEQLIKSDAQGLFLLADFSYDKANKINNIKLNGENLKVAHDNKQNPFGQLPYDLTLDLLRYKSILPYSYHFPNNITKLGNFTIEYTYNEGDLPTKASIYYKPEDGLKYLASEITYSYTVKEIKIEETKS
ncbi:hypothetical protein H4K35_14900 [Myroides sp. NP-2]|uniref:hypothetical protein n=1 Tax=Myroides sp. NP-2 TaxID=2759945 RepID=UPI0015FCC4D9|nr:hypothetical protein [Myroides sp. NP-2]MBB1151373.1 hypothetical protein [Myroides sp. NP-2]